MNVSYLLMKVERLGKQHLCIKFNYMEHLLLTLSILSCNTAGTPSRETRGEARCYVPTDCHRAVRNVGGIQRH